MVKDDLKFPIFNGNGLEDPEKHLFLCDIVKTMWQVQDDVVKRAQMITTFRGHALDWYMKFFVVQVGTPQKSLDQILTRFIDEFKNPKYES